MTDLNKEREICDQYFEKYWDDFCEAYGNGFDRSLAKLFFANGWGEAKAQAIPEWISVEEKLPEITDASVLAHFQNGSIETVHIEDWFKDITDGLDEDGRQKYTKWYLKASNTITHWAPLLMPPIEAEN
ncbi:DUF551 domain-containing protein [Acinetobacter baumannii]|uniref:DUF551 domain-containing protein n=1 Tax=Acinetobacter baumannii TaxID=470 RepID=UPI0010CAD789|nr:DUF551 domain-containing protein [Acinetobacter baumannii]TKV65914.1 DUF551 domain-containing protein [Acinetobacter baumannii]TKV70112.1 DUF551 domain-containing protein [Acinetobacter baumannii]